MRMRWQIGCLVVAVVAAGGCGGSDNGAPSDDELRGRLLPAAELKGFEFHRGFVWDNPIDVIQGLHISENTPPSDIVNALEDAEFVKGAGEILRQGPMGPQINVDVLTFESDSGATDFLERVHREDLKQPCYGLCSQIARELAVNDIPGAKAAASLPDPNAPPEAPPPFEGYAVEFTVGEYLYVVSGGAEPDHGMKELILGAARALYARVKDR